MGSISGLGRSPGIEMATHSSILAWRIQWTEGHGGLQSIGSQRIGHDWAHTYTQMSVSCFSYCITFLKDVTIYVGCNHWLLCPWDSPHKNTEVGSHCLLQGIFPSQGWIQVFYIAGRFFTIWATREVLSHWGKLGNFVLLLQLPVVYNYCKILKVYKTICIIQSHAYII